MSSILTSTKKLLGLDEAYTAFDQDIIMYINSALASLRQLGAGPATGFSITGTTETWADFLGADAILGGVQNFVYLKVRLVFDIPQNTAAIEAMERQVKELEWRIRVDYEA